MDEEGVQIVWEGHATSVNMSTSHILKFAAPWESNSIVFWYYSAKNGKRGKRNAIFCFTLNNTDVK